MQHSLRTVPIGLTLAAIACCIFGYYPLLQLGTQAGLHIDISLLYLLVVLAVAASLPLLWRTQRRLGTSLPIVSLIAAVLFTLVSTLWSANPLRAAITASFFGLVAAFAVVIALQWRTISKNQASMQRLFSVAICLAVLWAVWQIVGEALGIDRGYLLLPAMYDGSVFGVARPTGFMLEPQFLASLLLIPIGYITWRIVAQRATGWLPYAQLGLLLTVLILTLSRGALLGGAVMLLVLCVVSFHAWRRWLAVALTGLAALTLAGGIIWAGATLRSDDISGPEALGRTLSHLSLGKVTLSPSESSAIDSPAKKPARETTGYVKSSTESRLSMSSQALDIWRSSPQTMLVGVGIGGFGASLSPAQPGAVVNNYYLELLAETGLVGLGLFAGLIVLLLAQLVRQRSWLLLGLLAGALVQMCFFSGNANAVHVWAVIGVALSAGLQQSRQKRPASATID